MQGGQRRDYVPVQEVHALKRRENMPKQLLHDADSEDRRMRQGALQPLQPIDMLEVPPREDAVLLDPRRMLQAPAKQARRVLSDDRCFHLLRCLLLIE